MFGSTDTKGVFVVDSAGTTRDGLVPIKVCNVTNFPQKIGRGEKLAKFEVWDENTETFPYELESNVPEAKIANRFENAEKRASVNVDEHEPNIDWSKSKIDEKQKQQLNDLVREYSDCFVNPKAKKLGLNDLISCNIETKPGTVPQHGYPYHIAPEMRDKLKETIKEQVRQGLVEETIHGAWATQALLVMGPEGELKMLMDFRALNAATLDKILKPPRLADALDSVGETELKLCSILGWVKVWLRGIQVKYMASYVDDVICHLSTFGQQLLHLRELLDRFRQALVGILSKDMETKTMKGQLKEGNTVFVYQLTQRITKYTQLLMTDTDQTDTDKDTDNVIVTISPEGNTKSCKTMPDPPVIKADPINNPQPKANMPLARQTKHGRVKPSKRRNKCQAK